MSQLRVKRSAIELQVHKFTRTIFTMSVKSKTFTAARCKRMPHLYENFCFREKEERTWRRKRRPQASRESARPWEQSAQHLERVRILRNRPPRTDRTRTHTSSHEEKHALSREERRDPKKERGSVRERKTGCGGNERIRWRTRHHSKTHQERDTHVYVTRSYLNARLIIPGFKRTRNRASMHREQSARCTARTYARGKLHTR